VASHLPEAHALGVRLASRLTDPDAFERDLTSGLRRLADVGYAAAQAWIAPGSGPLLGVRWPLLAAVERALAGPLRQASPAVAIYLADRLANAELLEVRLFAHVPLRRSLPDDPERSWQLIRRLARRAGDWVSVDSLAGLMGQGILLEPYRWAELEQLVYSPYVMERRLVGSTLAELPFRVAPAERAGRLSASPALRLVESLIGDDAAEVQKALAWALRSWRRVDAAATADLLRREAARAAAEHDGHRAWVVRDALRGAGTDPGLARDLRALLRGVRRHPGLPSTSRAAAAAALFSGLPDAHRLAEAPL
jgi:3-methyladenine DNA glycosylase AlkD